MSNNHLHQRDNGKNDQQKKYEVKSIVFSGVSDVKKQDAIILENYQNGYTFMESVLIGGNDMILRFQKKV